MCPNNRAGRPIKGGEAKSVEVKIRIEPYLVRQMDSACTQLNMSRSAFIRYAIEQLIKVARQHRYL